MSLLLKFPKIKQIEKLIEVGNNCKLKFLHKKEEAKKPAVAESSIVQAKKASTDWMKGSLAFFSTPPQTKLASEDNKTVQTASAVDKGVPKNKTVLQRLSVCIGILQAESKK